ncbi:unnamed protein product [Protopolystoma xenopodis]|uniref:PAP-associated domain-containing protein n=1 Tax=Protopolystoma xenopodis TaxID=117903 RepID=A0A448XGL5_9PLAT|nr:unnamed protein product [Protopolystoma xenopodis]
MTLAFMLIPFQRLFDEAPGLSGALDLLAELPWHQLRSSNRASLASLFSGFITYYAHRFDYFRDAVSVRNGAPLPVIVCLNALPPQDRQATARAYKVFVEGVFIFGLIHLN